MTDILLRLLSNSRVLRSSYCKILPSYFLCMETISCASLPIKVYPRAITPSTSDCSSGDSQFIFPVRLSITIEWHKAKNSSTSSTESCAVLLTSLMALFRFSLLLKVRPRRSLFFSAYVRLNEPDCNVANFLNSIWLQVSVPVLSEKM